MSGVTFGETCHAERGGLSGLNALSAYTWQSMLSLRSVFAALLFVSAIVTAQSGLPQREGFASHIVELSDDELDGLGGEWRLAPEPENTWRKKEKKEEGDGRIELGVDYEQMQQQLRYQNQLRLDQQQRDHEPHPGTQFRARF